MTISVLQEIAMDNQASSTSIALAFASNVTAGSSIHVACTCDTNITPTVADSLGNTYTLLDGPINDTRNSQFNCHWICNSASGGANTVTISFSPAVAFRGIALAEIGGTSGYDTGKHAGQFQSDPGTAANAIKASSTGVAPTSQPGLIHLFCISSAAATSIAAGSEVAYMLGLSPASNWPNTGALASEHYRYTAVTALDGTFTDATNGAADPYTTLSAYFIESGGGGGCTNEGETSAGAFAVPNGSSGSYIGKSGAFVTPDCSTIQYYQPHGGKFGTTALWPLAWIIRRRMQRGKEE